MPHCAPELVTFLRSREDRYAEVSMRALDKNPHKASYNYAIRDLRQLVSALISLIAEALEGSGREIWSTFFETTIPIVLGQRENPADSLFTASVLACRMVVDVSERFGPESCDEAVDWLVDFFARFSTELARSAVAVTVARGEPTPALFVRGRRPLRASPRGPISGRSGARFANRVRLAFSLRSSPTGPL